jgi:hypothetical protein
MRAGDTFYLPDRSADGHLWIVISDPVKNPDRVLLVSMTSYDVDKADVCVIDVGEHPRVKHKTCVCYKPARATSLKSLDHLRDSGYLDMQESVSPELLRRIRRGLSLSRRVDLEHINTPEFLRQLKKTGQPVVLTINGKAELVVQDTASYQKLLEIAERVEELEALRKAVEEMKAGKGTPVEEMFEEMRQILARKESRGAAIGS